MAERHCIVVENSGVTHVRTREVHYTWTINDYVYCFLENGQCFESPRFTTDEKDEFEWSLSLHPSGYNADCKDYVSICPNLHNEKHLAIKPGYIRLCIVDRKGEERIGQKKLANKLSFLDSSIVFKEFVKRDLLYDKAKGLLHNGKLTILCKMYFEQTIDRDSSPAPRRPIEEIPAERRLLEFDDLERLLESGKFSDLRIVVAGGEEFRVHKSILVARSEVFAAMFEHGMKEQKDNTVKIEDIEAEVMREALRFVYAGKVKGMKTLKCELLAVADKYEFEGLKSLCEEALTEDLRAENIGDILGLVDKYGAVGKLHKAAIGFVVKHAKSFIEDEDFKAVMKSLSPALLADVVNALMAKL